MLTRPLSLLESRVLAVLMEKERTVPDSYPLSINSLVLGCNQKSSRNPVMELSDADVQIGLDSLKQLSLVFEASGGRVQRYEHNFQRLTKLPEQAASLLGVLMLRGPQTLSELRINSERWYKFADLSSVQAFMCELAERETPLVCELPKQAGMRETRWAHLLCGKVELPASLSSSALSTHTELGSSDIAISELANMKLRLADLETKTASLELAVKRLCAELGLTELQRIND